MKKSVHLNLMLNVVQGSNLGPVLFTIFFNDVVECFSIIAVYADDSKIVESLDD